MGRTRKNVVQQREMKTCRLDGGDREPSDMLY